MWRSILLCLLLGYLIGNLNGSVLISKWLAHDDVRTHGSGNAGFTNFFRNYGGIGSLLVIVMDGCKSAAACFIGSALLAPYGFSLEGMMLGAIAVTLGHDFPALLGFRGGKGIVCGFAAAIVMDWRISLILFVVFVITYFLTKYVSLSSVLGAVSFGVFFLIFHADAPFAVIGAVLLAALAIFMHRENLIRLVRGQERKTEFFKGGNHS